jgi:flagellar assembly factor FliW
LDTAGAPNSSADLKQHGRRPTNKGVVEPTEDQSTTTTLHSSRFGTLEVSGDALIEFPQGLVGLPGTSYALLARDEDCAVAWLHSLDDPRLAIPVADPLELFASFELELADQDTLRTGDLEAPSVYVTVRASADPGALTANLRAPLLVSGQRGHQVINEAPTATLQATIPRRRGLENGREPRTSR